MLKNAEHIALQNLPILYTFVLQAEIRTESGALLLTLELSIETFTAVQDKLSSIVIGLKYLQQACKLMFGINGKVQGLNTQLSTF